MPNMIRSTTEGLILEIIERFASVLPKAEVNKDVIFVPDELALRYRAEKDVARVKTTKNIEGKEEPVNTYSLEFINLWLESAAFSWKRQRTPVAREGIGTEYINETLPNGREKVKMFKAVPMDMRFLMSFWTVSKEKMDDFMQEFLFWQHDDPNVNLFYDEDKRLELDIIIEPEIEIDASKFINLFKEGKYWKHTFRVTVESWLFEGVPIRTAKQINLDMYITGSASEYLPAESTKVFEEVITEATP